MVMVITRPYLQGNGRGRAEGRILTDMVWEEEYTQIHGLEKRIHTDTRGKIIAEGGERCLVCLKMRKEAPMVERDGEE